MPYKPVPRDNELRHEVLSEPETRAIYEATKLQIELAIQLKGARIKKNMTQEEVAAILHTQKPAISRFSAHIESIRRNAIRGLFTSASASGISVY